MRRLILAAAVVVLAAVNSSVLYAQKTYVPGKTPWGDPDLQGTFTNKD